MTTPAVRAEHVTVPLVASPDDARLSFDNGLERLALTVDAAMEALVEARFGEPLPTVWSADRNVHVEYPLGARLLRRVRPSTVRINPSVSWSLAVHGGAAHVDADLAAAGIRSVSCHAGIAHSSMRLGAPTGECTIRLSSVKDLRIARPADVPVRVEVAKGAIHVQLDGRHHPATGRGLADHTPGYDRATNRYLVIVSGGVDTLTIVHHDN